MHRPYEDIRKYKADFRVKYNFYTEAEGGRKMLPYQGIRSDFWYHHADNNIENRIFCIWPEFEDGTGNVILENDKSVPKVGTARMWILNESFRKYHQERIKIGTIGYFCEGSHKTAKCEVIEILDLFKNPTE